MLRLKSFPGGWLTVSHHTYFPDIDVATPTFPSRGQLERRIRMFYGIERQIRRSPEPVCMYARAILRWNIQQVSYNQ